MEDPRRPSQPGWYPDPFGTRPEDQRYWDGETWLPSQPVDPSAQQYPQQGQPYHGQSYGQQQYGQQPYGQQQYPPMQYQQAYPGQPQFAGFGAPSIVMAGWWSRFGAYLIDAVILGIVSVIIASLFGIWGAFYAAFEHAMQLTDSNEMTAYLEQVAAQQAGPLLAASLVSLLVSAAYFIVQTAKYGRTLGKRALGIRVRRADEDALPSWGAAALRWLVFLGVPSLVSNVPLLSFFGTIFPILDGLWPLWDQRRQAIHDKVAKTIVVR